MSTGWVWWLLVDEVDKNIVRGQIDPLKDTFGISRTRKAGRPGQPLPVRMSSMVSRTILVKGVEQHEDGGDPCHQVQVVVGEESAQELQLAGLGDGLALAAGVRGISRVGMSCLRMAQVRKARGPGNAATTNARAPVVRLLLGDSGRRWALARSQGRTDLSCPHPQRHPSSLTSNAGIFRQT